MELISSLVQTFFGFFFSGVVEGEACAGASAGLVALC
jgi:hypothetical protein